MLALARTAFLVLLSTTASGTTTQESGATTEPERARMIPEPRDPASVGFVYDPRELYPLDSGDHPMWKRLIGPVGVGGFHVFPGRVTGPNAGPPRTIWGQGFGTSLWRDPVTGWPKQ